MVVHALADHFGGKVLKIPPVVTSVNWPRFDLGDFGQNDGAGAVVRSEHVHDCNPALCERD